MIGELNGRHLGRGGSISNICGDEAKYVVARKLESTKACTNEQIDGGGELK
jgi:hypothetical protein